VIPSQAWNEKPEQAMEGAQMKRKLIQGLVLVVSGIMLTTPLDLAAMEPYGVKLDRPMVVAGVYLRAAVYDVRWQLRDTHATVTFSRKGRAVATVPGELVTFNRSVAVDTLYFTKHPDGFFFINGLGFARTNRGIAFPTIRSQPFTTNNRPANIQSMENGLGGGAQVPRRISN
jgi:hypothetical protein